MAQPPALLLSGIALTGKTTLARHLIRKAKTEIEFIEGDDLHEKKNIEKMRRGTPLNEQDRALWKSRIGNLIAKRASGKLQILTCSALTRSFRDDLRKHGEVRFVFLVFGRESANRRSLLRSMEDPDHYFQPQLYPALLDGQYRDLEIPGKDERDCLVIDLEQYPSGEWGPEVDYKELAGRVLDWFHTTGQ